jgi:predicted metal-dependent TIM-barrel fold hydrolase
MTSRTTDDYAAMASAGIVAVIEPRVLARPTAHPRRLVRGLLLSLTGWERFRASQFGIRHFCTIAVNPKGSEQPGELAAACSS